MIGSTVGVGASPQTNAATGISVVVCTHNGALRLPKVLSHLRAQRPSVQWELVLVDNASTDDTATVAQKHWVGAPTELRVVHEPRPGLGHARKRGIEAARFDLISFVDDDNWLAPDWLERTAATMAAHHDVGACGGRTEAVFEIPPPEWLAAYQAQFVIGPQADKGGDITESRGHLWGAGMTIRKSALTELARHGFEATLVGRTGTRLISGEDYELCFALRMAGWRLWYEPALVLRHYMPAGRITWEYMLRLNRGHGATSVRFDPYELALGVSQRGIVPIAGQWWIPEAVKSFAKATVLAVWVGIRSLISQTEGWPWALTFEFHRGRCEELMRQRKEYDRAIRRIAHAPWARVSRPPTAS